MSDATPSPRRLALKLFADPDPGPKLELEPFIGLFHDLIREKRVEGLLIDVADYAHVPEGPGILLVGHEVDYGLDLGGGRTGLLVTRKHCRDATLRDTLRDLLRKALGAARAIEASGIGGLRFATGSAQLLWFDRLAAPNGEASLAAVRSDVEAVLADAYGDAKLEIVRDHVDDARRPFALRVTVQDAPPAEKLLERLGSAPAPAPAPAREAQSAWDIDVEELARLRESAADFVLVDVREPHEFEICNLGGKLVPLGSLAARAGELDPNSHVVVHCRSGGRSAKAVEWLRQQGFANAWNVNGGILAWIDRIDPSLTRY